MASQDLFDVAAKYLIEMQTLKHSQYKKSKNSRLAIALIISAIGIALFFVNILLAFFLLAISGVFFFLYSRIEIEDLTTSLSLGYIPVRSYSTELGNALIDLSGVIDETEFFYSYLNRVRELISTTKDTIELGKNLPIVQKNHGKLNKSGDDASPFPGGYSIYDKETDFYNKLDELQDILADYSTDCTSIPLLNDGRLISELLQFSSDPIDENLVLMKRDETDATKCLDKIIGNYQDNINNLKELDIVNKVGKNVELLGSKFNSVRGFSLESLDSFFDAIDLSMSVSSYHFYCPECNKQLIDELVQRDYDSRKTGEYTPLIFAMNTRMLFQPEASRWRCPVCELVTDRPVPINRIVDEAIYPTYDFLIREHFEKRIDVYAHSNDRISDIKIHSSQEIDKYYDEFQGDMDQINTEILNLEADLEVNAKTISSFNEQISKYENIRMNRLRSIEEHAIRQQEHILSETARVRKEFENFVDGQLAEQNRQLEENVRQEKIVEAKRDEMQQKSLELQQKQAETMDKQLKATEEGNKAVKFIASDARAKAKKRGDLKPPAWNIPGRVGYSVERLSDTVSFKSDVEKEEKRV